MLSIGEKVARLREAHGWTLKELSVKSGVSLSHISAIENETRPNPSIQRVLKLAKAFGVSLAYFDDFALEAQPYPPTPSHEELIRDVGSFMAGLHAQTADPMQLVTKLQKLYDAKTQAFIVSETSRPYIALAMQLASENPTQDPSVFLQMIAQFIRDQNQPYQTL